MYLYLDVHHLPDAYCNPDVNRLLTQAAGLAIRLGVSHRLQFIAGAAEEVLASLVHITDRWVSR